MSVRLRFALLGAALALAGAEGAARLYGDRLCTDAPGVFYQADPRTGWTHVPNLRGFGGPCEGGTLPSVPLETGPTGLLDPPRPFDPPPGVLRVVLTGGNGPEGLGVRPDLRMARALEAYLTIGGGLRAEVIGAGTGGWALDNMLAWLRAEGLRYRPALVILVVEPGFELRALSPTLIATARATAPAKPFLMLLDDGRLAPAPRPLARPPAPPAAVRGPYAWSQLVRTVSGRPRRSGPPLAWSEAQADPAPETVTAELARVEPLAEAIFRTLREEAKAAGAEVLVALAPRAGEPLATVDEDRVRLARIAGAAGLAVVDLDPRFRSATLQRRAPFLGTSGRWSAVGHDLAAESVFTFARERGLLPRTGGGERGPAMRWPSPGEIPGAIASTLWTGRWSALGRFVVASLLAAFLGWVASVLPGRLRAWVGAALGVAVLAAAAAAGPALAATAVTACAYGMGRWSRFPRRLAPGVLVAGIGLLAVGPVLIGQGGLPGERIPERLVLALASGMLVLRLVAYARERSRVGAPATLGESLASILFVPTMLLGPFETPGETVRRGLLPAAPAAGPDLARRLAEALRGLVVLGRGLVLLALVPHLAGPLFLVSASGGAGLAASAMWAWLAAHWLLAAVLFAGLSDVGSGLVRVYAGRRPPPGFASPWRSTDPADFWRRWLTSFHGWIVRDWYGPVAWRRPRWRPVLVLGVFALATLWWMRTALVLFGIGEAGRAPVVGFAGWGVVAGLSVVAAHLLPARRPLALAALLLPVTALTGALAWIAFFWPPQVPIGQLGAALARLLGAG